MVEIINGYPIACCIGDCRCIICPFNEHILCPDINFLACPKAEKCRTTKNYQAKIEKAIREHDDVTLKHLTK